MKTIKVKTDDTTNTYIDSETGEVINIEHDVKHHKIVVGDKESFFKVYFGIAAATYGLDRSSYFIILWCVENAHYNSNIVALTKPMCDKITGEVGIKYHTIKNSIVRLKKKGFLIPMGNGTYRINPKYFWRGDDGTRRKTMKYVLEVECKSAND